MNKELGQVFTYDTISINLMIDKLFTRDIKKTKIVENSCGDGQILIAVVKRILLDYPNDIEECLNNLYAFEIDEQHYKTCLINLNNLYKFDYKVFNVNTFFEYKKYINFFDVVIGNPPYLNIENNDEKRNFLKSNFIVCKKSQRNLYIPFVELSIKMLNDTGTLLYIIPNGFVDSIYSVSLRAFLMKYKVNIYDFKKYKIFDANVFVAILEVIKNGDKELNYFVFNNNKFELYVNDINDNILRNKNIIFNLKKYKTTVKDIIESTCINNISDYISYIIIKKFEKKDGIITFTSKIDNNVYEIEESACSKITKVTDIQKNIEPHYFIDTYNKNTLLSLSYIKEKTPKVYHYLMLMKPLLEKEKYKKTPFYNLKRNINYNLTSTENKNVIYFPALNTGKLDFICNDFLEDNILLYNSYSIEFKDVNLFLKNYEYLNIQFLETAYCFADNVYRFDLTRFLNLEIKL